MRSKMVIFIFLIFTFINPLAFINAAVKCTMVLKDQDGCIITGDLEDGSHRIYYYFHAVTIPVDPHTGKQEGSKQHAPIEILKEINQGSPLIIKCLCNGNRLKEVTFRFYRIDDNTGEEVEYFNVKIEDARIISFEMSQPNTKLEENKTLGHLEKIKFTYSRITWTYLEGSIEYTDNWGPYENLAKNQNGPEFKEYLEIQNFPNPFNSATTISIKIPTNLRQYNMNVSIHDITGRVVKNIVQVSVEGEDQKILWDGMDNEGMKAPSGLYIYKVAILDEVKSGCMVFLK